MNQIACQRAVVAVTVYGWRQMLADQTAKRDAIKTLCPGLTVCRDLEEQVAELLTASDSTAEEWLRSVSAAFPDALSA